MAGLLRMIPLALAIPWAVGAMAQNDHANTSSHREMVEKHGAEAMGFDQQKTQHHFQLTSDGGTIRVTAKSADDATSIAQIRMHLSHQTRMFSTGDFAAPQHTHGVVPPGVPDMIKFKDAIAYQYVLIPNGAELHLHTSNTNALRAIHDFLKFQIEDHETGDPQSIAP